MPRLETSDNVSCWVAVCGGKECFPANKSGSMGPLHGLFAVDVHFRGISLDIVMEVVLTPAIYMNGKLCKYANSFLLILDEMVGVAGWVAMRGEKDCFAANKSCLCCDTPADPPKKDSAISSHQNFLFSIVQNRNNGIHHHLPVDSYRLNICRTDKSFC